MRKKKVNRVKAVKKWFKHLFEQPQIGVYSKPSIYITGGEMEIKNFIKIVDYTEECLCVETKGGQLNIVGDELSVKCLEKERVLIKGVIFKIEFSNIKKGQD